MPDVQVIAHEHNLGYAAACNHGLSEARGRYVFFLNADTKYDSGSAAELLRWLDQNPSVALLGPRVLNLDGSRQFSCRGFPGWTTTLCHRHSLLARVFPNNPLTAQHLRTDLDTRPAEVDWASGCCLLARKSVLREIGGFDDGYFLFFEDVDLAYRLKARNWKCVYYPALTFYHAIGVSRAHLADQGSRLKYVSAARYFSKHLIRNEFLSRAFRAAMRFRCGLADVLRRP
jgi:GT2 family glycosyltransferase